MSDNRRAPRGLVALLVLTGITASVVTFLPSGSVASTVPQGFPPKRVPAAAAADADVWFPTGAVDDRRRGVMHTGLRRTTACAGGFAVEDIAVDEHGRECTHGPDPAPRGVDASKERTAAELRQAAATDGTLAAAAAGAVPCYGDGVSGKRVQVIY